ncbi:hypothetical protein [Psychromonas ossibalaenae]|uniref:hypothetical protein n=1 Tax=Psychromonas ossibalaenae TaxID=444922 RepID=UPI000370F99B|nr:hypothetical protein [Psychromonas ossibalaenae]
MHKRINQIIIVAVVVFGGIYFLHSKINSPEECKKIAGVWNESEQTCEQTLSQIIYENLSAAYPVSMDYPETDKQVVLDKQEKIDNSFYLRGHYQDVLQEAADGKEALYDRGSLYLNMSKMVLLTEAERGLIHFAAPFVVNTAGSGVFVYVGLFSYDSVSKQSRHLDSVLLGNRVREEKINLFDNEIRVDYLGHAQGQSNADYPTEPFEKTLLLLNLSQQNEEAKFKQVKRMHSSWDKNRDGINDCESEGSCDHTVDYSKARP